MSLPIWRPSARSISGTAVFLSFVFLAPQLRQANRNQRSLMQQARTGRNVEILLTMADLGMSGAGMSDARICSRERYGGWMLRRDCRLARLSTDVADRRHSDGGLLRAA